MTEGSEGAARDERQRGDAARIGHLEERVRLLSETTRAFAETTADLDQLLDIVTQRMAQIIGDSCVLLLLSDDGELLVPASVHARDPALRARIAAMFASVPFRVDQHALARHLLATGEALLIPRVDVGTQGAQSSPEYVEHFKEIELHSVLVVAVRAQGRQIALLSLRRCAPDSPPYSEADRDFAQTLADHAGLAINNARLLQDAKRDAAARAHAETRSSRLAAIIESSSDAILAKSLDGTIESWNAGAELLFGYSSEEALGQLAVMLLPPERRAEELALLDRVARGLPVPPFETARVRKDGTTLDVSLAASPIRDAQGAIVGVSTIARDISASKRAERLIRESLAEKVVMLKEIHHRVKNNLQVVSSILRLHEKNAADPAARAAFAASQGRVRSIALLHEKLYQSSDLGSVRMAAYARDLATMLIRTRGEAGGRVSVQVEDKGVLLPVNLAAPCGLLLNELLTNAFNHAFVGHTGPAVVRVVVSRDHDIIELTVADNGIGLPPGFDITRLNSLGMFLARTLAEQLGGTIEIVTDHGTRCTVRFSDCLEEG
ncbi:MAG: histidine kinase dimerization/phosphoacceptor domain -containing protein [Byssovorax sp.]